MVLIKRFFPFFLFFLFVFPVSAAEDEPVSIYGEEPGTYVPYSYIESYSLAEPTDVDISVQALDPVTPSNSNGLKAILLDILGDYSAITVEYRYTNSNGTYNYLREVQPDYVWIGSAALFIVLIWCTFKLGGAILCRR